MKKEFKPKNVAICRCHKIPAFLHELNQSILVIQAYVNGCGERIKERSLDNKQLGEALNSIINQINIIYNKINSLNYTKLLSDGK